MAINDDPLRALDQLARSLPGIGWFTALGDEVTDAERAGVGRYLTALKQRPAPVRRVRFWREAQRTLGLTDAPSPLDIAEAAERRRLSVRGDHRHGAEILGAIRAEIEQNARDIAHGAAASAATRAGIVESALARAASVSAADTIGAAAIAIAAGEPDHPFCDKLRWFVAGRWPLGLIDGSFWMF